MTTPQTPERIRPRLPGKHLLRRVRTWLASSFGVHAEARTAVVERMLEGHARNAASYWLQLFIALALATLGLALNGSAVVIGAMLVSPLMGPIIELAMGLAVGSPLLSIRSFLRTFWSIVFVIAGSALLTRALPFHEVTSEIAARASPTALDLLVAIFCALAAAFTTLRSSSEGASAAAGTAVAIALVPPLCAAGFGLGTADRSIALGAFLLFTANLCGILLFAALTFWLFGFNLVPVRQMEERRLDDSESRSRSVRWARRAFGSRYGTSMRFIIPLALVALVWLPLSRALREVSWEVRTRAQIQRIIHGLPLAQAAVRSSLSIEHREVRVRMVVVGKPADGRMLQTALTSQIAKEAAVVPSVEVVAVPDLDTMEEVTRRLARTVSEELRPPSDPLKTMGDVGDALKGAWPAAAAGPLRRWRIDYTDRQHPVVEVVHLGPPLGPAAEALLASMLSERFHASVLVRDLSIPSGAITAEPADGAAWLQALSSALAWLRGDPDLAACVTLPPSDTPPSRGKRRRREELSLGPVREAALAQLSQAPHDRLHWEAGKLWSVQLQSTLCGKTTADQ